MEEDSLLFTWVKGTPYKYNVLSRFFLSGFFYHKKHIYLVFLYKIIVKYINFNTIVSFNISIDIINNSIDYVYCIKNTMDNMKNLIQLITIYIQIIDKYIKYS